MSRTIKVKTVSEEILIQSSDASTLQEVVRAKRLPPSLFQGYLRNGDTVSPVPLTTIISTIPENQEIELQCIRNTELKDVIPQRISYRHVKNPVTAISDFSLGEGRCLEIIQEFDSDSARRVVKEKIAEFMKKESRSGRAVVGISGGGDSNTLAQGLRDYISKDSLKQSLFFTIIFDPIWPSSAAERASTLCQTYGLEHEIINEDDLKDLLHMKKPIREFYNAYCELFGDNTNHFFGTYLISLVARNLCRKLEIQEYILGFNREDLLADLLFSLINGQKPLPFPVREFGDIRLLMPLWDISKSLLDSCYPKYSLSNYKEREEDQSTYQRNIMYYLAHGVEDVYPNLGLSLMQGVQKIFKGDWSTLMHREESDLYISEYADPAKVKEVEAFLMEYFGSRKSEE